MNAKQILDTYANANIGEIIDTYCSGVDVEDDQKAKAFFRKWEGRVPAKLIRQCIFAGIYWAITRPENRTIIKTNDQD